MIYTQCILEIFKDAKQRDERIVRIEDVDSLEEWLGQT